jgi:CRISPR system Cascade subunit CasA
MPLSFNLVDEPWLPIVWLDGAPGEVGLRDALVRAHEIRELVDGSPLVTVSLHRLLLAILHRTFGPETFAEWKALWQRGRWDAETLDGYFATWRHRFDLFDAERPFSQVARLEDGTKAHPPSLLAMERAAGNNATMFDHSFAAGAATMRPAEAARQLVARQAFSVGGGVSKPFNLSHASLTTGFTVLAVGETLFQTLALNLTEYGEGHTVRPTAQDAPSWEQDDPHVPKKDGRDDKEGTPARGPIDHLTWISRRIRLIAADNPLRVTGVELAQNLKPHVDTLDPCKSYVQSSEQGWVARRLDPDRAVWRDSHAIFQQSQQGARLRPAVFNWLARIDEARDDGEIEAERAYPISVLGLGREATAKAADISIWRHERFTVPLAYLHDQQLLGKLEAALIWAEDVGRLLRPGRMDLVVNEKKISVPRPFQALAEALLPSPDGRPDRKRVDALIDHLAPERRYWSKLEVPFRRLLEALPEDRREDDEDGVVYGEQRLPEWAGRLRKAAWAAFREATDGLDSSARALEAVARAEQELRRRLADLLSPHLQERKGVTA